MLKVLELFGGIGACTKALKKLGIDFKVMDYVEINKHSVASYNAINGTDFKPQDITKWDKQLEVDFVCNQFNKKYYIQSALSLPTHEKTVQEERPLLNIQDNFKKIIIVKDSKKPWITEEGILVIGIFEFLLNKNSLDL